MINYFSCLIRLNWLTNEFKAVSTIIILVIAITSAQDIAEGNTHSATKIYQSTTHAARKKKIIIQNLRLNHKIRKRVTTVYKEVQQFR
jgi:hypothetical protein